MATNRPTTTGGSPMPVLTMLSRNARPGNLPSASSVPSGRPISRLRHVAAPEICSESSVTWKTSLLKTIVGRETAPTTWLFQAQVGVRLAGIRHEQLLPILVHAELADHVLHGGRHDPLR